MNKITIVLILSSFCGLTYGFALAPATVGGIVSSAGRLSNTIKETKAWKRLTSNPNSIVRALPARAMEVVQEVVERVRALLSETATDDSQRPPELILLREKFTAKSQLERAQLQIRHKEEMDRLKSEYDKQFNRKQKRQPTFDTTQIALK